MDSDFSQRKIKKQIGMNWNIIFVDSTIKFLREIREVKCADSEQCVDEFQERFGETTLNIDLLSNKIYSLFGKISVICCDLALYQYDYLDFVSNEELFADCQCDMMLVDDTLGNCLFYSEYGLSNFDRLCFACSINFLKMVSAPFIHFKNDT